MNQYHIYEAIGRGKHSTVYKGRKKKSIEYYAIKSVDKSQKSRVLQEVRTLHSLDHNNVLKFYAWYETSAHLWLVLEYCVGGDLLTLLRQDVQLPEESIHDFARDLVQALQFLHSKGVIYCDLKPSNVLLDEDGRLKLCDFGLARRLGDISKSSVQQLPQAKRGTPCYMAPELFQDGGVHSFASDLWALGCVMYECFSGRPPFVSKSFTELVNAVLFTPTPPLKGCPTKEFEDLVNRLLVKDPAHRIQWKELREHPFWRSKFKLLSLPSQPAYINFLRVNQKSASSEVDPSSNGDSVPKRSPRGVGDSNVIQGNSHTDVKKADVQIGRQRGHDAGPVENIPVMNGKKGQQGNTAPGPLVGGAARANGGVNLLRLSKIVKTNLQRETDGEAYRKPVANADVNDTDVTIENHDMELNFNDGAESEVTDEDETVVSTTTSAAVRQDEVVAHVRFTTTDSKTEANQLEQQAAKEQLDSCGQDDLVRSLELHSPKLETLRLEVAATPPGVGIPRKGQRAAAAAVEQGTAPIASVPRSPAVERPALPLSNCLWHPSDLGVRPIMTNKRSEKLQEPTFDARSLPVDPLTFSDFVKLPPEQIEPYVTRMISSIHGNTALTEKLNTLKYLESLCCNIDSANILINGPLMPMLVKMLRVTKPPGLRMQLTSVMGLLIRHATLIEEELGGSGIVAVLTETLRDKQDKVRRCAMATLGELLFYIATQTEGSPRGAGHESPSKEGRASCAWQVPSTTIALVGSILRKGEDDLTQHYALKTVENIASQGGEWASRFTNHETLENLCHIYKAPGKQESLRSAAGSCLVRLVRFTPTTIPLVLERVTFKDLVSGLAKGTAREQQVNINLLNMALVGSSVINNMGKYLLALLEERALVPSIVGMLEQGPEVLRGKAFVCAALLCKINRRWLPSLFNAKLLPAIEKLMKEKDPYVQQCAEALVQTILAVVPGILESISSDIQTLANSKRPGSGLSPGGSPVPRSSARSSIPLFPVVLHLFTSATFRDRLVDEQLLKRVLGFMKFIESASFQGQDEFQSTLLQIVEVLSQQSAVVLSHSDLFINRFLPSLSFLYRKNTDGDMRFLCLKIFFDSVVLFLEDMSGSTVGQPQLTGKEVRKGQIEGVIKQQFLPIYSSLVADEDPIPMYAQKLLVMLLDAKCIKTSDILQLKLVSQFFDFLSQDLAGINLHDVKLCLFLACAPEVETQVLSDLQIVGRLGGLLDFVHAKGMEDFLEPVLCLCRVFLVRSSGKSGKGRSYANGNSNGSAEVNVILEDPHIQDIAALGRHAGIFVELSGSYDPRIAETASESLVLLLRAVPMAASGSVLSNLTRMAHVLEVTGNSQGPNILSLLQRRLLFAVTVACKEHRSPSTNKQYPTLERGPDIVALETTLHGLRSSSLPLVAEAATAAVMELQLLVRRT